MFKVYFQFTQPNPEWQAKLDALNQFQLDHSRLAFEPRSMQEIEDHRTYAEMSAEFRAIPQELPPTEASGILVQAFANETFIVLYNDTFITLGRTEISRAEYLGPDPTSPTLPPEVKPNGTTGSSK